jgi:DNA primase
MEITEIKQQLTVGEVLDHYGLKTNTHNMLCCPFHEDKTPSLQVYRQTNTWTCFSSNCDAGSGDVIDFIMRMDKSTKHEAILKAKELAGYSKPEPPYEKLFKTFLTNVKKADKAQAYLKERGLNPERIAIGYNNTTWGQMRYCLIFPLKSKQGKIVSLYGRNIYNTHQQRISADEISGRHYYTRSRKGLYPHWPKPDTKQLILTEAIIDAATLLQTDIRYQYGILACYGTNGFTAEHEQAIKGLKELGEVIIFFDGDEAGREGTKRISEKLRQLNPQLKVSYINTPENEDVNSLSVSHESEIFTHLVENRTPFIFSIEEKKPEIKSTTNPQFDTTNPLKLTYRTVTANYYVKGGLRNEADSMRVSLDIEHPQNHRKSRTKLDLYEDKQVERIAREAAEKLQLRADLVQLDLELFTGLLEQYRESQQSASAKHPPGKTEVKVSPVYEKQALEFLRKPNLIQRWNELIGRAGVVGEENNRIFLMVIACSYKMPETLHALIQGSSGSGKTHLMSKIYGFIPEGEKKVFTRLTEGNLYHWGEYELCHTLMCIEDLDGLEDKVLLALRELISSGALKSGTSVKDDNGRISSIQKIVYGPIASMCCTTKGEVYEDNMGRCFIIAVDESKSQTLRIIEYQNKRAAGKIDDQKEKQCTEFIQTLVSLLQSYEVINPYADRVHLPQEAHKIRRLNGLYQSFVKAITVMHQYQRGKDDRGRLISEKEDLQIAAEIMFESILLKVDELDGSLRQFYERLKEYVKVKAGAHHQSYEFGQREIRQALHVSKSQLQRYLHDLQQLEYIRQSGGYANRGFSYKVLYWDNIEALRAKVKRHLQGQLDQLELVTA